MRYVLITTKGGKNFGDEAVCRGLQNIISSVDKNALFILIDKENKREWSTPILFDKAVWCGMPLFWSYGGDSLSTISWWELLTGWVSQTKNDFIILGAGSFCPWKNEVSTLQNQRRLIISARKLKDRSYKISIRDNIANKITKQDFEVLACPSVMALEGVELVENPIKIVNIMPYGSHYQIFNLKEAECWQRKKYLLTEFAKNNGYVFVAHNKSEYQEAVKLGFDNIIFPRSLPEFLSVYKRCVYYIGNRIHGSLLAKTAGAKVMNIGYDSRQECINLIYGMTCFPSEVNVDVLNNFESLPQRNIEHSIILQRYKTIVEGFLKS